MQNLSSQIIVNIINEELGMPTGSVWLRDQNKVIPNDNGLYIIAGIVSAITVANVTEMQQIDNVQTQVSTVQQQENVQVDVLSNSTAAMTRAWEVIAAMQSFYSQQQQELNNFKIFRIPRNFVDTSDTEGGSTLKKYSITIPCLVWYRKSKAMPIVLGDYYDDFATRLDDYKTIGTNKPIAEFEITPETPPPYGSD